MVKLQIWYQYLLQGKTRFVVCTNKFIDQSYGGKQFTIQIYEFTPKLLFFPKVVSFNKVYWKPLKINISKEALPNLSERGKVEACPYVLIWFEIEKQIEKFDLYSIKLISKVKLESKEHGILSYFENNNKIYSSKNE